jgi:hypothetical protein
LQSELTGDIVSPDSGQIGFQDRAGRPEDRFVSFDILFLGVVLFRERVPVMNIYVGNLSYTSSEDMLRELFEAHGTVTSVRIITDRETGRSRGFGFVEMEDSDGGKKAIEELNRQEFEGRTLVVNEARPKTERGGGGGGGRGGGGGGYGGGGGGGYGGGGGGGYGGGGGGGGNW